ncbi:hypothetical protein GCM10009632_24760 [Mycolicibacterium alvei]|uniref:Uncharacterized protein n=1 Tax=Mycolicibacterium alvei TaxID=67081 RepID=A0A6N4UZL7_9MYCO|nr:hypothetical protein MALV_49330 [Mycolicibacterium alvei]
MNPGPIESIAMMICVAFIGGGGAVSVVSVLCGAGGGLTVQPLNSNVGTEMSMPIVPWARRRGDGTSLSVSTDRKRTEPRTDRASQPLDPQMVAGRHREREPAATIRAKKSQSIHIGRQN